MTDIIEHGAEPNALVDETGLNVRKSQMKGERDQVMKKKGATRQTVYVRGENPRLTGSVGGEPIRTSGGALQGLALVHPSTAVSLLNLPNGATVFGFEFTSTTKVIVNDPTVDRDDTKEDDFNIPFTFWPALASYSSATS